MSRRHTVLLADDHTIVTDGLARLLMDFEFDVVGAVADGHQLIGAAMRLRPDVIVTDVSMPGLSGLDILARLKTERVDSKVIVLTMHRDPELATMALRDGASGFLLKESAGEELLTALRQVLQGRVYLTPAVTRDVMRRMAGSPTAVEPQLTPRQRDVLRLVVKGQRMKEIAANLGLSTRTVESHKPPRLECRDVDASTVVHVLGMDSVQPAVVEQLFERHPGELDARFVQEVECRVWPGRPDHHRRAVRHETKTLFTRA